MNIRLFLIFVVMLCAVHQGPAAYRDLTCVEPEPRYAQKLFHYFTVSGIEKVCVTPAYPTRRIGNEVFCILLSKLLALLLGYVPSIGHIAREKWSAMVSMFQGWRASPSLCRHCGTVPCQVKRKCLWMPSGPRKKDKANSAERSKAMMLFSYGLELSVQLTKELPQDDLYWQRRFCDRFEEKHMVLFPLCIQRQINLWYPVPP
ncbi:uncharacterized protein LOC110459209 [Mizuhopecten yessoensis]|uniref:uncharacterized protein LOC110459209 n=1 Tax=Mizuhopecten yessoensis TaxID=6573 RepID=UPI000B45E77E|nr:uncharacterized protein LOC110459209 [Mizuhopecten yessoensis]